MGNHAVQQRFAFCEVGASGRTIRLLSFTGDEWYNISPDINITQEEADRQASEPADSRSARTLSPSVGARQKSRSSGSGLQRKPEIR